MKQLGSVFLKLYFLLAFGLLFTALTYHVVAVASESKCISPESDLESSKVTSDSEGADQAEGADLDCHQAVSAAEEASVGMDMAGYMAVTQTVDSVNQTVNQDSAKNAYAGSALIKSTVAGVAFTRCKKCNDAIDHCKTTCNNALNTAVDKRGDCQRKLEDGKCGTETPTIKDCTTTTANKNLWSDEVKILQEQYRACSAKASECKSACLQGALSGLQALGDNMVRNQMGDCNGPDCSDDDTETDSSEGRQEPSGPSNPQVTGLGNPASFSPINTGSPHTSNSPNNKANPSGLTGSNMTGDKTHTKNSTDRGKGRPITVAERENLENLSGPSSVGTSSSLGGDSENSNSGSSPSGSGLDMMTGSNGATRDNRVNWAKSDKKPASARENALNALGSASLAGYKSNTQDGEDFHPVAGRSTASNKGKNGDIKLALAGKASMGVGKTKENIFSQTSRLITKICYTQQRCYHKKQ